MASFSSNALLHGLNAHGAPQLKRIVRRFVMITNMTMVSSCLSAAVLLISLSVSGSAQNQRWIRAVDFRNFSYDSAQRKFALKDGKFKEGDVGSWYAYTLDTVKYVDFDLDGSEEAFVVVDFRTSGTLDNAKEYFVFGYSKGVPRMIFQQWREKPRSFQVKGRTIAVSAPFWKDAGLCSPSGLETSVYRWRSGRFERASRKRQYMDPNLKWWL